MTAPTPHNPWPGQASPPGQATPVNGLHARGYPPPPSWSAWQNAPRPAAPTSSGGAVGLAIISVLAFALAASIPFDDTIWWVTTTAWAVFGVLAGVVLVLSAAGTFGQPRQWTVSAVAAIGIIATWVLIALPSVASNSGFAATISALAAFGSVALTPGRRF